jgi:hypothetical protein
MTTIRDTLQEYTEEEFLTLITEICDDVGSEEYQDIILENFRVVSEHPSGSDLIYYPESGIEQSPAKILEQIKEWRAQNGKPGFKSP